MSTISSIHDAFYTMLSNLFPAKSELTDAGVLENNVGLDLCNGYGVSVETSFNSERLNECKISIERSIDVVLTKEVYAYHQDKLSFRAAEKVMLEDNYKLIKEFRSNETLNDLLLTGDYSEDTGIQRLFVETEGVGTKQFLTNTVTFNIEYLETV